MMGRTQACHTELQGNIILNKNICISAGMEKNLLKELIKATSELSTFEAAGDFLEQSTCIGHLFVQQDIYPCLLGIPTNVNLPNIN